MSDERYKKGIVYEISCKSTGKKYIGSTIQTLKARLCKHKYNRNTCSSKEIINGGNYEIILIEKYPCNSKEELNKRETYYIK
jgi:hypothetical protein